LLGHPCDTQQTCGKEQRASEQRQSMFGKHNTAATTQRRSDNFAHERCVCCEPACFVTIRSTCCPNHSTCSQTSRRVIIQMCWCMTHVWHDMIKLRSKKRVRSKSSLVSTFPHPPPFPATPSLPTTQFTPPRNPPRNPPLAKPDQAAVQEACRVKIILRLHLVGCQPRHQSRSSLLIKPVDQVCAV
jgi:hypothetical protein